MGNTEQKLRDLKERLELAQTKLAEVSAKEQLLAEQKQGFIEELKLLGIKSAELPTIIAEQEAALAQMLADVDNMLGQLPEELLHA